MCLIPYPVESEDDVEWLRFIRNQCRAWMTNHRDWITPEQQMTWWQTRDTEHVKAWLYRIGVQPIGFGLLRFDGHRWWATLGIRQRWRGEGHGKAIYRHLSQQSPDEVWIEVLSNNGASLGAARSAGFVTREERDGLVLLCATKETK